MSRWALAVEGLRIHLDRNILTSNKGDIISHNIMGEVFEALIAAIYLDSKSDLHVVQKVLRNIGFGEMTSATKPAAIGQSKSQERLSSRSALVTDDSNPVKESSRPQPTPARQMQTEPHLHPTPILADITNAVADHESQVLSGATGVPLISLQLHEILFRRDLHIFGIYRDLAKTFRRNPIHLYPLQDQEELEFKIFDSLQKCFEVHEHVVDLCSWFPALHRYARVLETHLPDGCTPRSVAVRRYSDLFNNCFTAKERLSQRPMSDHRKKMMHAIFNEEFTKATNTRHKVDLRDGTLVEMVRRSAHRDEPDTLLTALRIEERVRDYIRRLKGFPDWYDLPENRDKMLPPWRISQSLHADRMQAMIPTEVLLQEEAFVQPPPVPDTTRQPDMQVHPYASNNAERRFSKNWKVHDLRWLYFTHSPLSAGVRVLRGDKSSHAQTVDMGPNDSVAKIVTASFESDTVQTVKTRDQLSPRSAAQGVLRSGQALKYLYKFGKRPTALSIARGMRRHTDVSWYMYTSAKSPLLRGRSVTRNSGVDITDLSTSNRSKPYGIYNPTDGILVQKPSNTGSTGAKPTVVNTTTSTPRSKRGSVAQKPCRGRKSRSAIALTEKNRCGRAPSRTQSAISHGRESGPRGHAYAHDFISRHDPDCPFPSTHTAYVRRIVRTGSPFWQKRSSEHNTKAHSAPQTTKVQDIIDLDRPDHTIRGKSSETQAADSACSDAITHSQLPSLTPNRSVDADNKDQSSGLTALYERKNQPDRPKTAFGRLSAAMMGNKVWFKEHASKRVPTFTSFDPVERARTLKQGPGLKDPFARGTTPARFSRSGGSVDEGNKSEE